MTYRAREFDVDLRIDVDGHTLLEPEDLDDSYVVWSVFGNRDYIELTDIGPEDVRHVQDEEKEQIDRIAAAEDWKAEYDEIIEEMSSDFEYMGFDLGVVGTTYALAAIGCHPGFSCNAGAFGDHHHEDHPLVVFVAAPDRVKLLTEIATEVGVGLETTETGALMVYSRTIDGLVEFGREIARRSIRT